MPTHTQPSYLTFLPKATKNYFFVSGIMTGSNLAKNCKFFSGIDVNILLRNQTGMRRILKTKHGCPLCRVQEYSKCAFGHRIQLVRATGSDVGSGAGRGIWVGGEFG